MKNVTVFCSAYVTKDKYVKPAIKFARLVVQSGFNYVWGGSNTGLMGKMATAAQDAGGKIIGISTEYFKHDAREGADEMIITKDLNERKKLMLERSDAVAVMVGGVGTIDEITEMIELKKLGKTNIPIVFLNLDGFYDGLIKQFERMDAEDFSPVPLKELVTFTDQAEEAVEYIKRSI